MKTPILGSAYVTRSINAADNRMVNLYPEIVPEGGKEPVFLQRAPGLRILNTIGEGPIRGLWQLGNFSYVVSGSEFYELDSTWQFRKLGDITPGTTPVSMTDNGTQIFIACNPAGYIYNALTDVFQRITDPDYPGAVSVGFIDGYFVFNEPNSQRFWITSLFDGTSVDPLDFASAEGSPDGLVALIVDHREIWLFGTNSVEVWYNAGLADFPFTRIQGAYNEIGCIAPYSIAKMDNEVFWLGADARGRGIVYKAKGYSGERVSTHAVEWQIQEYTTLSDAIGYTYQQDGHSFYMLSFPNADKTWTYDVATQAWHERASWTGDMFTRHRSNCQVSYNNQIVVGDYRNGDVYAFDLNRYTDYDQPQKWLRSWRALATGENNLKRTTHHNLQLDCQVGVGLEGYDPMDTGYAHLSTQAGDIITTQNGALIAVTVQTTQGVNPQVMLRWSDNGGHTWSNEHWRSMGRMGQYGYRTIWRRLGMTLQSRDRVYEVSGTDPVKIYIMGAELIMSPTNA